MKCVKASAVVAAVLVNSPGAGSCQELAGLISPPDTNRPISRPEIVRIESEKVYSKSNVKTVIVGNAIGRYTLSCNMKAAGCMSPALGQDYYVIKRETRWRMPGATHDLELATLQEYTATYFNAENIGLIRVDSAGELGARSGSDVFGMFTLGSWQKR